MSIILSRSLLVLSLFAIAFLTACSGIDSTIITSAKTTSPTPTNAIKVEKGEKEAIFAGGCFWGVEAVFEHIKGVRVATSGYSGGTAKTADYESVSYGRSKHAEAVQVIYDPKQVTYDQLLKVFFSVVHNPTQLNYQGPDVGTQYRSAIFYTDEEQKTSAENYVAELTKAKTFDKPIVTDVVKLDVFYNAETYHQDYLVNHPNQPYIVAHDMPKLDNLSKQFPDLFKK